MPAGSRHSPSPAIRHLRLSPCRQARELHLIQRVDGFANFVRSLPGTVTDTSAENAEAMVEGMENEFQAFADSLGAAGKVDDQGSFADDGHAAAEHGAVSDLGRAHTDIFGDSGGVAVGYCHGCLGCLVTQGESGPSAGQDEVHLALVRKTHKLRLEQGGLIGNDHGLYDLVSCFLQHLYCRGAALVLPLSLCPLVAEGNNSGGKGHRRGG